MLGRLTTVILLLFMPVGLVSADAFDDANADYSAGKYEDAFAGFKPLAERGNVLAQSNLGYMYAQGEGVPQNYIEAVKWYRKAAEQGNAREQSYLGYMYSNGHGVTQDDKEAVKWIRKSAEQGDALAQFNLGHIYSHGEGVSQDYTEAAKWFRLSADQGNAGAQSCLGSMYLNGEGVPKDYVQAHMWWSLAAASGYEGNAEHRDKVAKNMTPVQTVRAQSNLGYMYAKGQGVRQDDEAAVKWFRMSAEQGYALLNLIWAICTKEGRASRTMTRKRCNGTAGLLSRVMRVRNII